MENIRKIYCLIAMGAFLWLLPSIGLSQPCNATIVGGSSFPSIMAAVTAANPGATINVEGTCTEIVFILAHKNFITLNGGGTATITCPTAACAMQRNVMILGKQITITGFNITGAIAGIVVAANGAATIDGNTIHNTKRSGIVVLMGGYATILNNTIHDTGEDPNFTERAGILVCDNASALIGFNGPTDTAPSPNIIQNNPTGILLTGTANARIVGNTVSNNTNNGIMVIQGSQAEIAGNDIDDNGQNGIFVSQGSGVYLGTTNNPILDLPNSGTNGDKGLSCSIGGYVDGLLGTLHGLHGALGISKGCFNSVTK
jgi:parallel beta-helix repeat protein